ncbi:hypothetical protein NHX12_014400, partial [Muraenolepis orangiensis]
TFLVRKCGFSHRKLLCLRATKEPSPASIRELFICEEDSTFSLESSALSFPDLCRMVAFYCISRDVLPFPLELPEAIAGATTHRQLEAISHMGQEFWNAPGPSENGSVGPLEEFGPSKGQTVPAVEPPLDLFGGPVKQGKLCFINPLFLQLERHRFKRSMRVCLSTDGSMHLSVEGPTSASDTASSSSPSHTPEERLPQRKVHAGAGLLRRTPAITPCSVDDEELLSARPSQKRVTRLVEELSRDRRSAFGSMGLRLFLSQAKTCLLDSGELEPSIHTLVPESEQDLALERAMFSCVLRPLKKVLDHALVVLHRLDGSSQRLAQNLLCFKAGGGGPTVVGAAFDREVERVRQKLGLMQRSHSPIDKVLLLLQACKCVHKAMGSLHRQEVSWEDFLPPLTRVIVECNRPHILLEVEYMMELLEPSWLCGEGGYYLSSVYASLCLIQSPEAQRPPRPPGCLTREAQEELREWGRRRGREAQIHRESQRMQRCVRILFQDGEQSAVRTLQWRADDSAPALAQLCAEAFGVPEPGRYALYWRSGGEMRPLPAHARPRDLAGHSEGGPSLSYLRTDHDFSKMRRLTRGGAVDLSESVCEE